MQASIFCLLSDLGPEEGQQSSRLMQTCLSHKKRKQNSLLHSGNWCVQSNESSNRGLWGETSVQHLSCSYECTLQGKDLWCCAWNLLILLLPLVPIVSPVLSQFGSLVLESLCTLLSTRHGYFGCLHQSTSKITKIHLIGLMKCSLRVKCIKWQYKAIKKKWNWLYENCYLLLMVNYNVNDPQGPVLTIAIIIHLHNEYNRASISAL